MKILFAADGSTFTKKALAFLVTHEAILSGDELVVLHVQPPLPPRVHAAMDGDEVSRYYKEEATAVLAPIDVFLRRHAVNFRTTWVLGHAADEIVKASEREGAHLIVMGTHGYGLLGRVVMGSVAQNVVTRSEVPVLLVK